MEHPLPKLTFLHAAHTLNPGKLDTFRKLTREMIVASLRPGDPGCLKTRPDGKVLDGHHRLVILLERGEDIDALSREIIERQDDEV